MVFNFFLNLTGRNIERKIETMLGCLRDLIPKVFIIAFPRIKQAWMMSMLLEFEVNQVKFVNETKLVSNFSQACAELGPALPQLVIEVLSYLHKQAAYYIR